MRHEAKDKYTELLDLRTHLTVAILAAAQLKRKSPRSDDLVRLQGYLDRSLVQLQDDITDLESLVEYLDEQQTPPAAPLRRRFPTHWIGMAAIFLAAKVRQSLLPSRPQAMQRATG